MPARSAGPKWVVKAQAHTGGRGKAGGIKLCANEHDDSDAANELFGKRLVTHQTGPQGKIAYRVYVEGATSIERELYFGFVLDRGSERVLVVASAEGGMDIEEIAAQPAGTIDGSKLFRLVVDEVEKVLFMTNLDIAERYASLVADPETRDMIQGMIRQEHGRTRDQISLITESDTLAERFPALRRRTGRTRPLIDRTNRLQVDLLRSFRAFPHDNPESGRSTGSTVICCGKYLVRSPLLV